MNAHGDSVGILSVASLTETLTHAELAAAVNGTAWPDDPLPPTLIPAVMNYPQGIYTHSAPDLLTTSRNGELGYRQQVQIKGGLDKDGMSQLSSGAWAFSDYLDRLQCNTPNAVLIDVPYHSQWTADADHYVNDCGPASLHMVLDFVYQKRKQPLPTVTTRQLSDKTTLSKQDTGLTTSQLIALASQFDLKLNLSNRATLNLILAQVAAGLPVLSLISYGPILDRQDKGFTGGHFVVVVGYDRDAVYLNDPDWRDNRGKNFRVPMAQFEAAINTAPTNYQAALIPPSELSTTIGTSDYAIGYDVSHHNDIDYTALGKKATFVFHKATEGTYFTDSTYPVHRQAVRAANPYVVWGAFHFGTGGDVAKQVLNFVRGASLDGKALAMLDLENNPDASATSEKTMTLPQAADFVQRIKNLTDRWPILYTRKLFIEGMNSGSDADKAALAILANCPLFLASEGDPPAIPAPWVVWQFQQYKITSPTGQGNIDTDRFNGSIPALQAWANAQYGKSQVQVISDQPKGWGVQTLEGTYSDHLADYPIFKSVNGVGAIQAAHARNPGAIKVARFYDQAFDNPDAYANAHGGPQAAAKFWFDTYWPQIQQIPYAFIEGMCEASPTPVMVAIEIERVRLLSAHGVKAVGLNLHVGEGDDSLWARDDIKALAWTLEQTGGAIGLHCYGQGVISASSGACYWRQDGSWSCPGTPLPATIDSSQSWLALRIVRIRELLANAGLHPLYMATELGIDDCAGEIKPDGTSTNGIYLPHGVRTRGWRTCWGVWQAEGWTSGTISPGQFLRLQLDWWVRMTDMLGLVYAWNDRTGGDPGVFDVRDAL